MRKESFGTIHRVQQMTLNPLLTQRVHTIHLLYQHVTRLMVAVDAIILVKAFNAMDLRYIWPRKYLVHIRMLVRILVHQMEVTLEMVGNYIQARIVLT